MKQIHISETEKDWREVTITEGGGIRLRSTSETHHPWPLNGQSEISVE